MMRWSRKPLRWASIVIPAMKPSSMKDFSGPGSSKSVRAVKKVFY
jgi:hypothetical protein